MKREILKYPDQRLKKVSEPVEAITGDVKRLIEDMFETMYANNGVGLAAPQVGELLRVVVLDVSPVVEGASPFALVNPEIIEEEGTQEGEEGCLCIPEFTAQVQRAMKVSMKGIDAEGSPVQIDAEGYLARALQHEVDHLNGILFVDRLSPVKRDIIRRKYLKKLRSGVAM